MNATLYLTYLLHKNKFMFSSFANSMLRIRYLTVSRTTDLSVWKLFLVVSCVVFTFSPDVIRSLFGLI